MGITELNKDGDIAIKGDPKVLYTTMMLIRTGIVCDTPLITLAALKIAFRYGCVRRQFSTIKGTKDERKVIDYQSFQTNLVPHFCTSIRSLLMGNYIREQFKEMKEQVE